MEQDLEQKIVFLFHDLKDYVALAHDNGFTSAEAFQSWTVERIASLQLCIQQVLDNQEQMLERISVGHISDQLH